MPHAIVKDGRKIKRLMVIEGKTYRATAEAAGWKSHTYLLRLLNGQATTVNPDAAARIAAFLNVAPEDIFFLPVSTNSGQQPQAKP